VVGLFLFARHTTAEPTDKLFGEDPKSGPIEDRRYPAGISPGMPLGLIPELFQVPRVPEGLYQ